MRLPRSHRAGAPPGGPLVSGAWTPPALLPLAAAIIISVAPGISSASGLPTPEVLTLARSEVIDARINEFKSSVTDKVGGGKFSGYDQRILSILAGQVAITLKNADLYEKATVDALTKVYVRRFFDLRLEEEIALIEEKILITQNLRPAITNLHTETLSEDGKMVTLSVDVDMDNVSVEVHYFRLRIFNRTKKVDSYAVRRAREAARRDARLRASAAERAAKYAAAREAAQLELDYYRNPSGRLGEFGEVHYTISNSSAMPHSVRLAAGHVREELAHALRRGVHRGRPAGRAWAGRAAPGVGAPEGVVGGELPGRRVPHRPGRQGLRLHRQARGPPARRGTVTRQRGPRAPRAPCARTAGGERKRPPPPGRAAARPGGKAGRRRAPPSRRAPWRGCAALSCLRPRRCCSPRCCSSPSSRTPTTRPGSSSRIRTRRTSWARTRSPTTRRRARSACRSRTAAT